MTTYIYHKDSTLWAFEGPEEPDYTHSHGSSTQGWKTRMKERWLSNMSTARESALPVVNAEEIGFLVESGQILVNEGLNGLKLFAKPGETVALPGWGLEKVYQYKKGPNLWEECTEWTFNNTGIVSGKRQAYRLVRSEPLNVNQLKALDKDLERTIKLTFYSGKLWHSDKPFPVNPDNEKSLGQFTFERTNNYYGRVVKDWLSTAYEVVNPEVIPGVDVMLNDGVMVRADETGNDIEPLQDGDELTLPEGYGIEQSETTHFDRKSRQHKFNRAATITTEKPDIEPSESQEEMWNSVKAILLSHDTASEVIKELSQKFTITSK